MKIFNKQNRDSLKNRHPVRPMNNTSKKKPTALHKTNSEDSPKNKNLSFFNKQSQHNIKQNRDSLNNRQPIRPVNNTSNKKPSVLQKIDYEYNKKINTPNDNVETTDFNLFDAPNGESLTSKIYYSEDATGELPVIFFSHGLGGSNDTASYLCEELASNGYVVIAPEHVGSNDDALGVAQQENPGVFFKDLIDIPEELENRTEDISFLLDNLDVINASLANIEIDTDNIGMAGHSFGAATTMALAGADYYTAEGEKLDLSDDRIDAFIALSPEGSSLNGEDGFRENSWDDIENPVMMITGTNDTHEPGTDYTWNLEGFDHLDRNGKNYSVVIDRATHSSFGNNAMGLSPQENANIHKAVNLSALSFFDANLNNDRDGKLYLGAQLLEKTDETVHIDRK